ncbi:MAG: SUMF1/EgtB/PvdO family nonheme iron enzyme [Puniceicoccaceae bacterium]
MKLLHKYGTRRNEIRRAKRELYFRLGMVAAILVFFALMIIVAKFRPRLADDARESQPQAANMGDPQSNPQLIPMREEVEALVQEFRESSSSSSVDTDDLDLLERAMDIQRRIIRLGGSDIASKVDLDRLYSLETIYDEQMGAFLVSQSKQLEQDAEIKWIESEFAEALRLMQRASDLQDQVNSQFPRSPDRDPSRLHVLNNKIMVWKTGPMAEKADQLKLEAMQELEAGNYETAVARITEALETQKDLSATYRDSRNASIARMKEFETAYANIMTSKDVSRLRSLVEEARVELEAMNPEKALAILSEAEQLQANLQERFPSIANQQSDIRQEIAVLQDTGSSQKSFSRIENLQKQTREALAQQDMAAFQSSISDWFREVRLFKRSFPRSKYLDQSNDEEVNFLYSSRQSIPSIMDMIYENLVPVPGQPTVHLYRTEVPQVLYRRITGTNPSAAVLPTNPVESLTWEEAVEFTRMAGWILSRPVSLPDRKTYMAALGDGDPAEQANNSWSSESSNRQIREVGTSQANSRGINDLLGNVSEWMASEEPSPTKVTAFGGAARDSRLRLATVPEDTRDPIERNRFIGFRFTVILED